MNEDFTQPFYVPIGKGKLNLHTGIRGGYYLPALEPMQESQEIISSPEPEWKKEQWQYVQQLRSQLIQLNKRLSESGGKSKKKRAFKNVI